MNGQEFLRRTRHLARRWGIRWAFETRQGKGSHGTLYFGDRKATIPDRRKEVRPGLLAALCRQLGIRTILNRKGLKAMRRTDTGFGFPARITRDRASRACIVSFRDLPEALTAGDDRADAIEQAVDCLSEALAGRLTDGEAIPIATAARRGEVMVHPSARIAGKVALHLALAEAGISQRELARRIGCHQNEVRRLLDPKHATKIDRLAEVLERLDWRMTVTFEKTAA